MLYAESTRVVRRPRMLVSAAAVAVATLFAAGCGAEDQGSSLVANANDAGTRTVSHLFGSVDVPTEPQRLVVLDSEKVLEATVALDAIPVAVIAPKTTGEFPEAIAAKLPDDVTILGRSEADVEIERVLAASPDLIIVTSAGGDDRELYDRVKDVAPTVAVDDTSNLWQATLEQVGAVVGKEAEAAELLDDYRAHVADVRATLGDTPGTASVVRVRSDKLNYMAQDGAFMWSVLLDAGFRAPEQQQKGNAEDSFFEVSLEETTLLDADRIFVLTDAGVDQPGQFMETVAANPLFARLQGRVQQLPSSEYLFGNITKANQILDVL